MFCNACGQQVSEDSAFCSRCGKPLSKDHSATTTRSAASQRTLTGQVRFVADGATRQFLRASPKVWLPLAVLLLLFVAGISFNTGTQQQPAAQQAPAQNEKIPEALAAVTRPTIPPPKFRVYRSKSDEGTSVVVSPSTTDEQLQSLLWLFREKVRTHRFKDIGITQPTWKQWGKRGYLKGGISVYRGEKCANEEFDDSGVPGPCGYGEHSAAYYQWGLSVDGVFSTDADSAGISASDGKLTEVFGYKDHWQLPAELQAGLDAEKRAQAEKDKVQQLTRKMFAEELQGRLKASGFDITVWARDEQSEELALDSDIFKDTAARVAFLSSILPSWRQDLCKAGFQQLRLIRGGLFSTGDAYSIGCK